MSTAVTERKKSENKVVVDLAKPENKALTALMKAIMEGDSAFMTGEVGVEKVGTKIIIPEGMTYNQAIEALKRQQQAEETLVAINHTIPCYPLDGIYALWQAFTRKFGHVNLKNNPGFFGPTPPDTIKIEIGLGQFEQIPYAKISPPMWEGGYLQPYVVSPTKLHITGQVKRKFEPLVKELLTIAEKIVIQESIYKGQAISIDLDYLLNRREDQPFNPDEHAPKFMDLSKVSETQLILSEKTKFALETNLFSLLRQTKACVHNNIPLKHGALFEGPFGTGKTLTARVMGKMAIDNNWTYIYLKSPTCIAKALEMAVLYAPAVLFCEDVDQVVSGERDGYLNTILNTIDGVDTKNNPIITVLTSNNANNIHPSFMRAGRIDTVIHYGAPDEAAAIKFIQLYAKNVNNESLLAEDIDLEACGKAMAGMIPAFIAEGVQKAKKAAIYRHGSDINGKVTTEDIVQSGMMLKEHIERANQKEPDSELKVLQKSLAVVGTAMNGC